MKRRHALQLLGTVSLLTLGPAQLAWGASIVAVRLWPAPDYTRLTIESDAALQVTSQVLEQPARVLLDLDGLELAQPLLRLSAKVRPDDPNIAAIRVAQHAPRVVRVVVDLKRASEPQVFQLQPIAAFRHRLVLDLHPLQAADPLQQLIAQRLQELDAAANSAAQPPASAASSTGQRSAAATSVPAETGSAPLGTPPADPLGTLIARLPQAPSQTPAQPASPALTASPAPALPTAPAAPAVALRSGEFIQLPRPPQPASAPQPPIMGTASAPAAATSSAAPGTQTVPGRAASAPAPASVTASPVSPPAQPQATATAPRSTTGGRPDRLIVVAIDPGHGGEDPGATGPGGTHEKDVVLSIARLLRERVNRTQVNGYTLRAFMTRDGDYFVPLRQRVARARRVQADLFVSVHADAFFTPRPRGSSVFALSERGATSAAAQWMANRENAADQVGGVNLRRQDDVLQRTLLDMSTTAQINDSLRVGDVVLRELGRVNRLHKPRVEQAGFVVLRAPDIPSVLVETTFISNPEEERRLRDPRFQRDMADALLRGIVAYFERNPPLARRREA